MDAGSALLFVGIFAALAGATIWFIVAFANAEEHARIIRRRLAEIERTRVVAARDWTTPWGDVVSVPVEMRAATRKTWGSEAAAGSGPVGTSDVIARRHGEGLNP